MADADKSRIEALGLYRGVMILAVVGIHVTGSAMKVPAVTQDLANVLLVLNRLLQFAVPGFLFMTALVFAHQYREREFVPREFYKRRLQGVLGPYLIWSSIFMVWAATTGPVTLGQLTDPMRWLRLIVDGKGYYHLYFLVIVLQFYLLLPIGLLVIRRTPSLSLRGVAPYVLGVLALQIGFFWLNRTTLRIGNVGSSVFSYTLILGMGMLAGRFLTELKMHAIQVPSKWLGWLISLVVLTAGWSTPLWYMAVRGQKINTFEAQGSLWVYAWAWAMLVLVVCLIMELVRRPESKFYQVLLVIGGWSMQIYLIHPIVIDVMKLVCRRWLTGPFGVAIHSVIYLLAVAVPCGVAWLLRGRKVSRVLFGR